MIKIKTNKKNLIILLTFAAILTTSSLPITANTNSTDLRTSDLTPKSSQFIPRTIRVAIYNEPNTTLPFYGSGGLENNLTDTIAILTNAGYQVTNITTQEIYDHKLKTADYDIFVMADNLPKANITNYVKEYWLGGGGLLSYDTAINFLCYAGILPPESIGNNGQSTYWGYFSGENEIYQRHPVSKHYSNGDLFSTIGTRGTFDWAVLQTTSIASDLVRIATLDGSPNEVTVLGFDPSNGGGRVVQMPWTKGRILSNMSDLVSDAIDWLCPRAKGRILFDLSHHSFYGVDSWNDVQSSINYGIWRNTLVSSGYTFDKLYPSNTGNLTASNLLPYDMLFLCIPEYNFTSDEVTAVTQWVNDGGGLIAIGEWGSFADQNNNINYLYGSYDLKLTSNTGTSGATYIVEHPTVEGCIEISSMTPGTINYTGDAFPIWGYDDTEICVAGQEYGNGRILLMSDVAPFRDSTINSLDNLQYAINVANWLTSDGAEILIYIVDNTIGPDANDNVYKGPVATALNDLGLSYYLTFSIEYFNMSLMEGSYDLAIIDHQQTSIDAYFGDILNYMKSGGYLILNTWTYRLVTASALWDYLGFEYGGNYYTTPQDIHIWDGAHAIFNLPAPYNAITLNTTYNLAGTDFTNVTLHDNATAIAGLSSTTQESGAAIILGAEGRAIVNTMHLTVYYDDTDDSTYPDALEIWENEIAYMWAQITFEPIIEDAIPGYNMYLVSFTIIFSIGIISILKTRKIRKN